MTTAFMRSFPLDDITIRSGGDGRTVEAYAAVFDVEAEIQDGMGHYREKINRAAFNKTVADRGTRFGVFYNHAMTLHGTPSERGSVPLGSPLEAPRPDGHGLVTVTRYNKTALADEVLEAIRNGDITGQSFTGRCVRSDPSRPRGGYRPDRDGALPVVTRHELALSEYGPTPIPAYDEHMLIGVRSLAGQLPEGGLRAALLDELADLDDAERAEFLARLGLSTPGPAPTGDEPVEPEPSATPEPGAGADEPREVAHSGRSVSVRSRARAALITRGM